MPYTSFIQESQHDLMGKCFKYEVYVRDILTMEGYCKTQKHAQKACDILLKRKKSEGDSKPWVRKKI